MPSTTLRILYNNVPLGFRRPGGRLQISGGGAAQEIRRLQETAISVLIIWYKQVP
jgi:hypothetical protein